ncbi:MAG: DUF2325 domain-containing protein [Campylobacterota bacterium]|nr:DUF2325 domain-containing protein [Campylobacterota bacterium]
MSILIIGGDKIAKIEHMLQKLGATKTVHWDSRRNSTSHKQIPCDTDGIIMLTDFLKHNTMRHFKKIAKVKEVPFVCVRRGSGRIGNEFIKLSNTIIDSGKINF